MPHLFYGTPQNGEVIFDEREAHHMRVVRLKEGQTIEATDGEGFSYTCVLIRLKKNEAIARILKTEKKEEESSEKLRVIVPVGRWERTRLLIEKCVELGVDEMLFHRFERSQHTINLEKAGVVVREAAKQCRRYLFPKVKMMEELNFNEKTIALDPDAPVSLLETDVSGSITIVVGPEGGFSDREKELLRSKTIMVNLGKKILRFETAAILTVGYIALRKQKI
ncbi:16S rRNA (uracil(1498)-N(3))-methyltransferase [Thermotoga sp.]|uniref:16S rRNA (uracil(1498)-N(3))-methyltransferase n=1 Tax=Thermotoga sp. TaxID=28240 RepID=UPI0025D9CA3C|nr:16S rRNA (uracil(1498)-N(3))-methyltransferase [Thermotoga sp.]MCD6552287.1 16S rRNA (uracil(1498)-N(3))-methyltransferase [Thermotoga sp.]